MCPVQGDTYVPSQRPASEQNRDPVPAPVVARGLGSPCRANHRSIPCPRSPARSAAASRHPRCFALGVRFGLDFQNAPSASRSKPELV